MLLEEFESVRIVLLGGMIRRTFHCTVASHFSGMDALSDLAVDKAFMAANGFSLEKGASTPDMNHSETKKLMISIAARVILLFDSSKLGRNSFAIFAPPDKIDVIVTGSLREDEGRQLEESGIETILAGPSSAFNGASGASGASGSAGPWAKRSKRLQAKLAPLAATQTAMATSQNADIGKFGIFSRLR